MEANHAKAGVTARVRNGTDLYETPAYVTAALLEREIPAATIIDWIGG